MPGGYFAHYLFTLFCMSVERSETLIRMPEKKKKIGKERKKNARHPRLDDVILGSMPKVEICQKKNDLLCQDVYLTFRGFCLCGLHCVSH